MTAFPARIRRRHRPGLRELADSVCLAAGLIPLAFVPSWASPPVRIVSLRTAQAPIIDGRLDDAAWCLAPPRTQFRNFHPRPGSAPSQPTELRIAHDGRCLYLAYRCHDGEPGRIRSRLAPRDRAFDDDWVAVIIDASGDGRSAAELLVNPQGCQLDARIPGDGSGDHFEVDYRFETAARQDSGGWSAEIAVPFASLRGPGGEDLELVLYALRHISRTGERAAFPGIDPADQQWLTHGVRVHCAGIARGTAAEVLPALTCSWRAERGTAGWRPAAAAPHFGLDAGWSASSRWAVQWTYHPDFSQVEADARQVQVNRRFPIYYPEKRPFFLEGREIFSLAAEGTPLVAAFHSRTIVEPRAGIKVSGTPLPGHALGLLFAEDEAPGESASPATARGAPRSPVAVLRYRWAPTAAATVGLYASERRRGSERCRVGGFDADCLLSPRTRMALHALWSRSERAADSGPGPGRQIRTGQTYALELERRGEARTLWLAGRHISPDFELPAGFLTRADFRELRCGVDQHFYPRVHYLNRVTVAVRGSAAWTAAGERTDTALRCGCVAEAPAGCRLEIHRFLAGERYAGREFDAGGWRIGAKLSPGEAWLASASAEWARSPYYDPADPRQGAGRTLAGSITLRAASAWEMTAEYTGLRFTAGGAGPLYDDASFCLRLHWQPRRRLQLRALLEWDGFAGESLTDWLISYTSAPGTVLHVGWGNLYRDDPTAASAAGGA
jgi:hypothetical protein